MDQAENVPSQNLNSAPNEEEDAPQQQSTNSSSLYLSIDDVMNFLSPSPKKFPQVKQSMLQQQQQSLLSSEEQQQQEQQRSGDGDDQQAGDSSGSPQATTPQTQATPSNDPFHTLETPLVTNIVNTTRFHTPPGDADNNHDASRYDDTNQKNETLGDVLSFLQHDDDDEVTQLLLENGSLGASSNAYEEALSLLQDYDDDATWHSSSAPAAAAESVDYFDTVAVSPIVETTTTTTTTEKTLAEDDNESSGPPDQVEWFTPPRQQRNDEGQSSSSQVVRLSIDASGSVEMEEEELLSFVALDQPILESRITQPLSDETVKDCFVRLQARSSSASSSRNSTVSSSSPRQVNCEKSQDEAVDGGDDQGRAESPCANGSLLDAAVAARSGGVEPVQGCSLGPILDNEDGLDAVPNTSLQLSKDGESTAEDERSVQAEDKNNGGASAGFSGSKSYNAVVGDDERGESGEHDDSVHSNAVLTQPLHTNGEDTSSADKLDKKAESNETMARQGASSHRSGVDHVVPSSSKETEQALSSLGDENLKQKEQESATGTFSKTESPLPAVTQPVLREESYGHGLGMFELEARSEEIVFSPDSCEFSGPFPKKDDEASVSSSNESMEDSGRADGTNDREEESRSNDQAKSSTTLTKGGAEESDCGDAVSLDARRKQTDPSLVDETHRAVLSAEANRSVEAPRATKQHNERSLDSDWVMSFGRFTSAAISVASSVAKVTAPVLNEAKCVAAELTAHTRQNETSQSVSNKMGERGNGHGDSCNGRIGLEDDNAGKQVSSLTEIAGNESHEPPSGEEKLLSSESPLVSSKDEDTSKPCLHHSARNMSSIDKDAREKSSWNRFAGAAASVAQRAMSAAAPVLDEAKEIAVMYQTDLKVGKGSAQMKDDSCVRDVAKMPKDSKNSPSNGVENGQNRPGNAEINLSRSINAGVEAGAASPKLTSKADHSEIFRIRSPLPPLPPRQSDVPLSLPYKMKRFGSNVSSVSGTISPASTSKCDTLSPTATDEAPLLPNSLASNNQRPLYSVLESKPSLISRMQMREDHSAKKFAALLSEKFSKDRDDVLAWGTKLIQRSEAFYHGDQDVLSCSSSSLSSPVSPSISREQDEVDSLDGSVKAQKCSRAFAPPEAILWDSMPHSRVQEVEASQDNSERPDFVVMPSVSFREAHGDDGLDWAMSSNATLSSVDLLGVSEKNMSRSNLFGPSDASFSSSVKRRPPGRKLSISSRGSGRLSQASKGSRDHRNLGQSTRYPVENRNVGLASILSPTNMREESDAASLGAKSFSPTERNIDGTPGLQQRSMSFPNLPIVSKDDPRMPMANALEKMSPILQEQNHILPSNSIRSPSPRARKLQLDPSRLEGVLNSDPLLVGNSDFDQSVTFWAGEELMLEEALVKFLSLEPITLSLRDGGEFDTHTLSLRWQQFLAHWKHNEVTKTMHLRHCSRHFLSLGQTDDIIEEPSDSTTGVYRRDETGALVLDGESFGASLEELGMRNLDGFTPHLRDQSSPLLTGYLLRLGMPDQGHGLVRHKVKSVGQLDARALLHHATGYLTRFTSILDDLVEFSSPKDSNTERPWYSVGTKEVPSIERKAKGKYNGDLYRVTDVLRARIIFPDEPSLVCALLKLFSSTKADDSRSNGVSVRVVRLKNLFRADTCGRPGPSSLPTGYRHVLVNVRLEDELVAEIQFNIASLFNVLGDDGCALHVELSKQSNNSTNHEDTADVDVSTTMQNLCLKLDQDVGYSRPAADFHQLAPSSPIRTKREAISSEPDTPIHRNTIHRPGSSLNDEGIAIPELKHGSEPSSDEAGIAARIDQSLKAGPTIANVENETDCETENVVDGTKSFGPEENFLRALVSFGAKEVIDSPRDAAAFHCLHTILVHLEKNFPLAAADRIHSQEDTVSLSIQCLLRCMALTDQSTSSGMMGWHEFGSNRMSDGIYSLSNQLASAFASRGQWKESGDVLRAMLLRCEQHLPLYHPITLAVLLDLAGVLAKLCKREQSQTLIIVATHRLGIYLEEVESSYFRDLNEAFNVDVADKSAFRIEKGCGSLSLLKAFVGEAERLSTRPMLSLFGPSHDVSITNGRLLADAFATLANCVSAGERLQGVPQSAETSAMYWRLAFIHYHRAFKVLTLSKGSENVSTVTVALSLARCLRQLGQPARALELLENVTQDDGCRSRRHPAANKCRARSNGGSRHTFTPHKRHEKRDYQERPIVTEIVSGLCFWSMAVLTLDNSPIAGLNRALRNLRLSKKWFKKALDVSHEENVSLRETCSAYLCTIDNEIKLLSDHGVSHNALPKLLHQYSFRGTRNEGR